MVLLGNPMLLAAMSDVEPSRSGLASGLVNTAFMMGGALGLAALASLAAARSADWAAGAARRCALNGGYQATFWPAPSSPASRRCSAPRWCARATMSWRGRPATRRPCTRRGGRGVAASRTLQSLTVRRGWLALIWLRHSQAASS